MAAQKQKKIGEQLLEAGLISEAQLLRALERQRNWGGRLGSNLVMIGALSEGDLLRFLAAKTGIEELNISEIEISSQIIRKIPQKVVEQFHLIPVYMKDKRTLVVAMVDPTDLNAIDEVRFITGLEIEPVITSYSSILQAIHKYYLGTQLRKSPDREILVDEGYEVATMEDHGGVAAVEDPDIIIFGRQAEESGAAEEPEPKEEAGFEFDTNPEIGSPEVSAPKPIPATGDLDQFSPEQRMLGLYQVLIQKRIVTETEIAQELTRLWSLGKLK